jgi:hypothetical protein
MTIVDLGQMDKDSALNLGNLAVAQVACQISCQNLEMACYTSLPPESQLQCHKYARGGRHSSLPLKTVTIEDISPTPSTNGLETDDDDDSFDNVEEIMLSSIIDDSPTNVSYHMANLHTI